jgi:hypothetical protein
MVVGMNGVTGQIVAGLVEEDYRPGTVFVKGLSMEENTNISKIIKIYARVTEVSVDNLKMISDFF